MAPHAWQHGGSETPQMVPIQVIAGETGTLGIIESYKHSPFSFKRFYFMTDLTLGSQRGGHAHKMLRQVLICLRGSMTIEIKTPYEAKVFHLNSSERALVLPPGYWRELRDFGEDTLVGVLASSNYDEEDYIRTWDAFEDWYGSHLAQDVPYLDLSRYTPLIGHAVADAMRDVVFSGQLIGGHEVRRFEEAFARYCTATEAIGVGNGLQALVLALRAAGIGPGDEVILPANTFIATALAVVEAGATPVLVDVELTTGLICVEAVAEAITERTAAIIPVHLYGHPADMDELIKLAKGRSIFILEDACQAHGALYKGRRCGSLGHAAAFSFYPTKNLGAVGDAGAVTTSDPDLADRIRLAGNYGSQKKYEHVIVGTNSRLDPVQAAALTVKLPYLDGWNETRSTYANLYLRELRNVPGLALPYVHQWATPVWHVFPIRISAGRRAAFLNHLARNDIGSNIHYPKPIHAQECFKSAGWRPGSFPVSEMLAEQLVSLPLDPTHNLDEIERVIEVVRAFFVQVAEPMAVPACAA